MSQTGSVRLFHDLSVGLEGLLLTVLDAVNDFVSNNSDDKNQRMRNCLNHKEQSSRPAPTLSHNRILMFPTNSSNEYVQRVYDVLFILSG